MSLTLPGRRAAGATSLPARGRRGGELTAASAFGAICVRSRRRRVLSCYEAAARMSPMGFDEPIHVTIPGSPADPRTPDHLEGIVIHRVPHLHPDDVSGSPRDSDRRQAERHQDALGELGPGDAAGQASEDFDLQSLPLTSEHQRLVGAKKPAAWEHLLYAGLLKQGMSALEQKW